VPQVSLLRPGSPQPIPNEKSYLSFVIPNVAEGSAVSLDLKRKPRKRKQLAGFVLKTAEKDN
jgi:hypothetical protein